MFKSAARIATVVWLSAAASLAWPAAEGDTKPDADPVKTLVGRLDLDKYKATIKGLTKFGDRRQGTDRNRAAVDWIEAQLKSYGCTGIARIKYNFSPDGPRRPSGPPVTRDAAQGGARFRGVKAATGVNDNAARQPDAKLRQLDSQASQPGEREEVYCTKVGSV